MNVHFSSNSDNWETPKSFINSLNFKFELDVCANHKNTKCFLYFTKEQNGLKMKWDSDTVWCNPPYSDIKSWIKKAYEESQESKYLTVVMLVPARTDTKWWHEYASKGIVYLLKGRIKFVGAKSSAPFPSALIVFNRYLDPKIELGLEKFIERFGNK